MGTKGSHIVLMRLELTALLSLHLQLLLVGSVCEPNADGVIVFTDGLIIILLNDLVAFLRCLEAALIMSRVSKAREKGDPCRANPTPRLSPLASRRIFDERHL